MLTNKVASKNITLRVSKNDALSLGFLTLFFVAFFFPSFHVYLESTGAILINTIIIIFSFFFIVFVNNLFTPRIRNNTLFFIAIQFFFFLLICISIITGILFGDVTPITRDFFEFHRPLLYGLVFLVSYGYFSYHPQGDAIFQKLLLITFFLLCFFSYSQFNHKITEFLELYTKDHNLATGRSSAPFANPYDLAFITTFFILFFFLKMIYENNSLLKRGAYIACFSMAVLMLLTTQSRSVAIGIMITMTFLLPLFFLVLNAKWFMNFKVQRSCLIFVVLFFLFVTVFLLSVPYIQENFAYMYGAFAKLSEGEVVSSGQLRMNQLLFALERSVNPFILVFGNGPAKDVMEYVESIYAYIFFRYGLLGLFVYFSQLFFTVFLSVNILRKIRTENQDYALYATILLWLLSIPFSSIGGNFTEQVRISFFYYTIIGLVVARYNSGRLTNR